MFPVAAVTNPLPATAPQPAAVLATANVNPHAVKTEQRYLLALKGHEAIGQASEDDVILADLRLHALKNVASMALYPASVPAAPGVAVGPAVPGGVVGQGPPQWAAPLLGLPVLLGQLQTTLNGIGTRVGNVENRLQNIEQSIANLTAGLATSNTTLQELQARLRATHHNMQIRAWNSMKALNPSLAGPFLPPQIEDCPPNHPHQIGAATQHARWPHDTAALIALTNAQLDQIGRDFYALPNWPAGNTNDDAVNKRSLLLQFICNK